MNKYQREKIVKAKLAEKMILDIKANLENFSQERTSNNMMLDILAEVKNINTNLEKLVFHFKQSNTQ